MLSSRSDYVLNPQQLPDRLTRIELATDGCGEITDLPDFILRVEKIFDQCFQIQPFIARAAQRPIVQVKAIDIDIGGAFQTGVAASRKAKAASERTPKRPLD